MIPFKSILVERFNQASLNVTTPAGVEKRLILAVATLHLEADMRELFIIVANLLGHYNIEEAVKYGNSLGLSFDFDAALKQVGRAHQCEDGEVGMPLVCECVIEGAVSQAGKYVGFSFGEYAEQPRTTTDRQLIHGLAELIVDHYVVESIILFSEIVLVEQLSDALKIGTGRRTFNSRQAIDQLDLLTSGGF